MDDAKIWEIIFREVVTERNFDDVNMDFWEFYKNNYDAQMDLENMAEYFEEYMKKTLHLIDIDKNIVFELFRVLKIQVPPRIRPLIEKRFSVVLNIDANNIILDYDNIRWNGNEDTSPPRAYIHPIQSCTKAARRIIQHRSAFTLDDNLSMANFLFDKMETAIQNNEKIYPKGNLIWRDYRREISRERAVSSLQSHFCRIIAKNLYKLPIPKERVLRMYKKFKIVIDRDMKQTVEQELQVKLKVRGGYIKKWKDNEDNNREEEDDEENLDE